MFKILMITNALNDVCEILLPVHHNRNRVTKADKDFAKKLDFKDRWFPVKVRDIHKIEKKNPIGISFFG